METLNEFDSFQGGNRKQYSQISEIAFPKMDDAPRKELSNTMLLRGGVFWSKNKKSLIAGKLQHSGKTLEFKTFIERLKNTVTN